LAHAGPDHEAIIRFGGEAPRRRAHSNQRFDDHADGRLACGFAHGQTPPPALAQWDLVSWSERYTVHAPNLV
jgi:hypothetical protein